MDIPKSPYEKNINVNCSLNLTYYINGSFNFSLNNSTSPMQMEIYNENKNLNETLYNFILSIQENMMSNYVNKSISLYTDCTVTSVPASYVLMRYVYTIN